MGWLFEDAGNVVKEEKIRCVLYHKSLNIILALTEKNQIQVFDGLGLHLLHSASLVHTEGASFASEDIALVSLPGSSAVFATCGQNVGLRHDVGGILLLETLLQTPVDGKDDELWLELQSSEAVQLLAWLNQLDLSQKPKANEWKNKLVEALTNQTTSASPQVKSNFKAASWSVVSLKMTAQPVGVVAAIKEASDNRQAQAIGHLASMWSRLVALFNAPTVSNGDWSESSPDDGDTIKGLGPMALEANRLDSFFRWPHMKYRYALPEQMAQAGFYHQPNQPESDRALCFVCNVCLVCWEPNDEPWSEHERHAPSCPYVNGSATPNVPLSVTMATGPAMPHGDRGEKISCISTTSKDGLIATGTESGSVVVWNVEKHLKREISFLIGSSDSVSVSTNSFHDIGHVLTSLCIIGPYQSEKARSAQLHPSLIAGISVKSVALTSSRTDYSVIMSFEPMDTAEKETGDIKVTPVLILYDISRQLKPPSFNDAGKNPKKKFSVAPPYHPASSGTQKEKKDVDMWYDGFSDPLVDSIFIADSMGGLGSKYGWPPPTKGKIQKVDYQEGTSGIQNDKYDDKYDPPVLQRIDLTPFVEGEGDFEWIVHSVTPTLSGRAVLVVLKAKDQDEDIKPEGILLLFSVFRIENKMKIHERPLMVKKVNSYPTQICMLPSDSMSVDDYEFSDELHRGYVACIAVDGELKLLDLEVLSYVTNVESKHGKFTSVTFCSSSDRICTTAEDGSIQFYRVISTNLTELEQGMTEGPLLPNVSDFVDRGRARTNWAKSPKAGHTLKGIANEELSPVVIEKLLKLTKVSPVSPYFSASAPSTWTELMSMPKSRRKLPAGLGYADKQTGKSWRLESDVSPWNEQVIELTLASSANLSHIDLRFNLAPTLTEMPHIEVSLLSSIMDFGPSSGKKEFDLKIEFPMPVAGGLAQESNPVHSPEFLEAKEAILLAGPLVISDHLDLTGRAGVVTLTSPELLSCRGRTFLVHIIALTPSEETKNTDLLGSESSLDLLTPATMPKAKEPVSELKGCQLLQEVSVTVRKLENCKSIQFERHQRTEIFTSGSLLPSLMKAVAGEESQSGSGIVSEALDLLIWMASILLPSRNKGSSDKKLAFLEEFAKKCDGMTKNCCILSSRSTAKKFAQLCIILAQCAKTVEVPNTQEFFCRNLLQSILKVLPLLPASSSSGGWRWLFMLLQRLQSLDRSNVMSACASILELCFVNMENRIHPLHTLLQTRYGFYGLAFEPELYAIPLSRPTYAQQNTTTNQNPFDTNPPYGTAPGSTAQPVAKAVSTQTPAHQAQSVKKILAGLEAEKEARSLVQSESQLYGLLEVEPLGFSFFSASEGTTLENCKNAAFRGQRVSQNEWESGLSKWSHLVSSPDLQQCILSIERMHSGARRFVTIDFGKPVLLTDVYTPACPNLMSITIETWFQRDESDLVRVALSSDIGTKPLLLTDIQPPILCRFLKMTVIGKYGLNVNSIKIAIGSFYGHSVLLPSDGMSDVSTLRSEVESKVRLATHLPILTKNEIEQELNCISSLYEQTRCCYQIQSSYLKNFLSTFNSHLCTSFDHVTAFLRSIGEEKKKSPLDEKVLKFYQECLKMRVHLSTMSGVMERFRRELETLSTVDTRSSQRSDDLEAWSSAPFPKLTLIAELVISTMIGLLLPGGKTGAIPAPLPENLLERLMDTVVVNSPPYLQLYCATLIVHSAGREPWFGGFIRKCMKRFFGGQSEAQNIPQERIFMTLNFMAQKCVSAGIGANIVDALLLELTEQLEPLGSDESAHIDDSLIDWLLLLTVQCLDKMEARKATEAKSSRWSFFGTDPLAKVSSGTSKKLKRNRGYSRLKSIMGKLPSMLPSVYAVKVSVPLGEPMDLGFDPSSKKITKVFKSACSSHSKSKLKSKSKKSAKDQPQKKENKPDKPLNKEIVSAAARGLFKYLLGGKLRYDFSSSMLTLKMLSQVLKMASLVNSLDQVMTEDDMFGLVSLVVGNKKTPPVVNGAEGATGFVEANSDEWYRHAVACFLEELLSVDKVTTPSDQPGSSTPNGQGSSSANGNESPTSPKASGSTPKFPSAGSSDTLAKAQSEAAKDFFEMSLDPGIDDYESDDTLLSYLKAKESAGLPPYIAVPASTSGSGVPVFKKAWPNISKYFKKIESSFEKSEILREPLGRRAGGAGGDSFSNLNGPSSPYMDTASPNLGIQHRVDLHSHIQMDVVFALRENELVNSLVAVFDVPGDFTNAAEAEPPTENNNRAQLTLFQSAFNRVFVTEVKKGTVDIERALSLWIALNNCAPEGTKSGGETGAPPVIVFTQDGINGLLEGLFACKTISLKGWCLLFQALDIICKQRTTQPTSPRYVLGIFDMTVGSLMANLMLKRGIFSSLIYGFLSGEKIKASDLGSFGMTQLCGPSVVTVMSQLISRLRIWCEILSLGGALLLELQREMIELLLKLCAENGPIACRMGPVDAQIAFVNSLVDCDFKNVDSALCLRAVDAVISTVTPRILQGEGVYVSNGSVFSSAVQAKPNGTTCFGSSGCTSQAAGLRAGDKSDEGTTYDGLLCRLLELASKIVAIKLPSAESEASGLTDQSKIERQADDAMQTDESKFEQARQASSPHRVQTIADLIIRDGDRFVDLLMALNKCRASNLAIVLGPTSMPSSKGKNQYLSVGDYLYKLTLTTKEHATLDVTKPLVKFLERIGGSIPTFALSEPVMWVLEEILSVEGNLLNFVHNNGLQVVCNAFVRCQFNCPPRNGRIPNLLNYLNSCAQSEEPGQKFTANASGFLCSTPTLSLQPTRRIFDDENGEILYNFAPLCTITSSSETSQAPTVLLQSNPPHRRSRAPAWSHHFYPNENSVDLTIALPSAIMLYEVQFQPHLTSLSTCPGTVIVESSPDFDQGFLPISGPVVTSGLAYISIKPSQPLVSSRVQLRLYKPRDSANVGLAQIKLLGTPALTTAGEHNEYVRSSLTWLELLTSIFSKGKSDPSLKSEMSQAIPDHVIMTSCGLLSVVPARQIDSNEASTTLGEASLNLATVLETICEARPSASLDILKELLRLAENPRIESIEAVVNLIYRICTNLDDSMPMKLAFMLQWLERTTSVQSLTSEVLGCVSSVLWFWKDDTRSNLRMLVTENLCLSIFRQWSSTPSESDQRKSYEYLLCSLCALNFDFFRTLMNWLRVDLISYPSTDDSKQGLEPELKLTPDTFCNGTLVSLATVLQSRPVFEFVTSNKFMQVLCEQLKVIAYSLMAYEVANFQIAIETFKFFTVLWRSGGFSRELSKILASFDVPLVAIYLSLLCTGDARAKLPLLPWGEFEDLFLDFLKAYCWCQPENQEALAKSLYSILLEFPERKPLIGFLPRVLLQLVLTPERTLIHLSSQTPMQRDVHITTVTKPTHPRYGVGFQTRIMKCSTDTTIREMMDMLTGVSNRPLTPVVESKPSSSGTLNSKRISAVLSAVNEQLSQLNRCLNECTSQPSIIHEAFKDSPLEPSMSVADCMCLLQEQGVDFDPSCLDLKVSFAIKAGAKPMKNAISHYPSILSQFVSLGGLLVLARHLPTQASMRLLDLEIGLRPSSGQAESASSHWVKVGKLEDQMDEYDSWVSASRPEGDKKRRERGVNLPFHSLAALGLFLRIPYFGNALLKDRKVAVNLLRLSLGVTDDGEGGDILSSSQASSLGTIPFILLRNVLEEHPPNTDDGAMLRTQAAEVGVLRLVLTCLEVFTSQVSRAVIRIPGPPFTLTITPVTSDSTAPVPPSATPPTGDGFGEPMDIVQEDWKSEENSTLNAPTGPKPPQYWAKGTGYGTGSTAQNWDVEDALNKQRAQEEQATSMLLVVSAFVGVPKTTSDNSGSDVAQPLSEKNDFLPAEVLESIQSSRLLKILSSYLRNDSIFDMARHVPLYKALLQLVRSLASNSQLVSLLVDKENVSENVSVFTLLTNMESYIQTYKSKLGHVGGGTNKEAELVDENEEGLQDLVNDIVETYNHTKKCISLHLPSEICGAETAESEEADNRTKYNSPDELYMDVLKDLRFDTYEMIEEGEGGNLRYVVPYHYESAAKAAGERASAGRMRRLAQEAATLVNSLPLSPSSSVFVRCDTSRLDVMKVLITGPADTPYMNGCFEFDILFPADYPQSPMQVHLETTGRQTVRFNPNLYNDGKVCLSVLNTWHGRPEEKWNPSTSSFLQVLVSIQSLILVPDPYFNEPGYERSRGTPAGMQNSRDYDANIRQATVRWAMLEQIRSPSACFKDVVHTHFYVKKNEIINQCQSWIAEMEAYSSSSKAVATGLAALKRHFGMLKEELEKLPCPPKLQQIVMPDVITPSQPEPVAGPSGSLSKPVSANQEDNVDPLAKKKSKLAASLKYIDDAELDLSELLGEIESEGDDDECDSDPDDLQTFMSLVE